MDDTCVYEVIEAVMDEGELILTQLLHSKAEVVFTSYILRYSWYNKTLPIANLFSHLDILCHWNGKQWPSSKV
jgi:hypothetical protein